MYTIYPINDSSYMLKSTSSNNVIIPIISGSYKTCIEKLKEINRNDKMRL